MGQRCHCHLAVGGRNAGCGGPDGCHLEVLVRRILLNWKAKRGSRRGFRRGLKRRSRGALRRG
eukprot:6771412-Pyramimonas_sp.AAC.3